MMKNIVVIGLGPVGITLAVASAISHPNAVITGLDINPDIVASVNKGECSFNISDLELIEHLKYVVAEKRFTATQNEEVLGLADTIILAVGPVVEGHLIDDFNFLRAIESISKHAKKEALLIISSTLPMGTFKNLNRLNVAYAYERITPGPQMLRSASSLAKVISASDEESLEKASNFFNSLSVYKLKPEEAEMAKLLENSYRAINIALIHEWTLIAEKSGINLFSVISAIKMRTGTHDNIRSPGPGVGGPCLLKDSMMALLNPHEFEMPFVRLALSTSEKMHDHLNDLIELVNTVGLIGASYRDGIFDVRNSPSSELNKRLSKRQISTISFDPLDNSDDFLSLLSRCEVLVLFHSFTAEMLYSLIDSQKKLTIIDTGDLISDPDAKRLHEAGIKLIGVGKGHWRTLGYNL